jgi:ribose transport system permease protein
MSSISDTSKVASNDESITENPDNTESISSLWVRIAWSPTVWSIIILTVLVTLFSLAQPDKFFTLFNLRSIAVAASPFIIMGVGVTYVLSAGGLDLSVGNVLVASGVVGVRCMVAVNGNVWVGLLACVIVGMVFGALNGVLIAYARIPALVVTIGTGFAAQGVSYILSGGQDLRGVPEGLVTTLGYGQFLGIPLLFWIAVVIGAVGSLVYSATLFGRHTYALGSNQEAAVRAGIRVQRQLTRIYTLSGALAGLAGFLGLAQFGTTTLSGHTSDFLYVLLAVILGGTSLFGGIGTVVGTCLAAFIPWVLNDGFIILGINPYWQFVSLGVVFVTIVYFDALRRKAREGVRR